MHNGASLLTVRQYQDLKYMIPKEPNIQKQTVHMKNEII